MAVLLEKNFPVEAGAFTTAGEASTTIKRTLEQLGIGDSGFDELFLEIAEQAFQ